MAKKPASSTPSQRASTPNIPGSQPKSQSSSTPTPAPKFTSSLPATTLPPGSSFIDIANHVWNRYLNDSPARTILLDVFMAFLVLIGAVQFLYAVVGGNYPFNAFLSGFSAAVGQFVLTASLRMQTIERTPPTAAKKTVTTSKISDGEVAEEGKSISSERAFADYILGSLILHGFCVNFIN